MKNRGLVLSATVLACTLASLARADTVLYSAPVVKATGEGLTCALLNVSTQTRNLKVDVIEFFTNTILDSEQDSADAGRHRLGERRRLGRHLLPLHFRR